MNRITIILTVAALFNFNQAFSQGTLNPTLDGYLENGVIDFYRPLSMKIRYPVAARKNGIVGLSVFTFKVDCNLKITHVNFETRLEYGIEEEILKQLETLEFKWKKCEDRLSEELIRIHIAFSINDTYDSEKSEMVINAMGEFSVKSDKSLKKKLDSALKKNNHTMALEYLTLLLDRYPYNLEYQKLIEDLKSKI